MNYSINIGDKNTYDDWHLIFPGKPIVNPPIPQFNYVEVLGKSGSLDYTEALTKVPRYGDREGSWEFIVLNPGDANDFMTIDDFKTNKTDLYSVITSYCNGRYFEKVWLEEDPEYYYSGRVWLSGIQSSSGWARVTLSYRFEPFKKSIHESEHMLINFTETAVYPNTKRIIDIHIGPGIYPSQVYCRATTTASDQYPSACRFTVKNPELDIVANVDFYNKEAGDSNYGTVQINKSALLSNIYGNNGMYILLSGVQSIGSDSRPNKGPIDVEYWWREGRL